jgi:hypothetical protein
MNGDAVSDVGPTDLAFKFAVVPVSAYDTSGNPRG